MACALRCVVTPPPSIPQMFRLTLRSSKDSVSKRLCDLLAEQF